MTRRRHNRPREAAFARDGDELFRIEAKAEIVEGVLIEAREQPSLRKQSGCHPLTCAAARIVAVVAVESCRSVAG